MKRIIIVLLALTITTALAAKIRVVGTYGYIKDLAERIGGGHVTATAMAEGSWDPHFIIPKPSLIAAVRKADLLIINGAQLEIGWLPPLLKQANNPDVMPSRKGFLDLSQFVELIQVPDSVSRAQGDVHPAGNPHFHLDPENILLIARAIQEKLCDLLPGEAGLFRKNFADFRAKWQEKLSQWESEMKPLSGSGVLEYHRNLDYFFEKYEIEVLETIEPLPGIPPTTRHMLELIDKCNSRKAKFIVHDTYHSPKSSLYLSEKTSIPMVILPHDIRAVKEATDIFRLFDEIVRRLKNA